MATEFENNLTPSDIVDLKNKAKEGAAGLLRIETERGLIKAIAEKVKEKYGIAPADFNKLVKMYHTQSVNEVKQKTDSIVSLYTEVFGDPDL
ncbi:transcriptional regulator [Vibrio phage EniLVp02]